MAKITEKMVEDLNKKLFATHFRAKYLERTGYGPGFEIILANTRIFESVSFVPVATFSKYVEDFFADRGIGVEWNIPRTVGHNKYGLKRFDEAKILGFDLYNFLEEFDFYDTKDNVSDPEEGCEMCRKFVEEKDLEGVMEYLEEIIEDDNSEKDMIKKAKILLERCKDVIV